MQIVSVMLLRSMQNAEGASMLKLKMMLCVMMLPLVVVDLHIKAVCQSVLREATAPPPAWIMQPPRLANAAGWDYFTLRERLITMQKQLEGTQKY